MCIRDSGLVAIVEIVGRIGGRLTVSCGIGAIRGLGIGTVGGIGTIGGVGTILSLIHISFMLFSDIDSAALANHDDAHLTGILHLFQIGRAHV